MIFLTSPFLGVGRSTALGTADATRSGWSINVRTPAFVGEFDGIAVCKVLQIVRQLSGFRNRRALHPYRDDWNVTAKGRGNLEAHEVRIIFKPTFSRFIFGIQPVTADHAQQNVTLGQSLIDHFPEVSSGIDAVDVHENVVAPKLSDEVIGKPAGGFFRVVPAIADEDFSHDQALGPLDAAISCSAITDTRV